MVASVEYSVESLGLQFKGTREEQMLLILLVAVMGLMVAVGIWQLARRRWYAGAMNLAAAGGPIPLTGLLLVSGILRRAKGQGKSSSAFVGAAAVAATSAGALILYLNTGHSSQNMMGKMILLAVWVALAIGVFYTSVYANLGTQRMALLMVLRCLAIASLMLILFKPAMSYVYSTETTKPYLPILVDRSGSMSVTDDPASPNRYVQAVKQLQFQNDRIEKLFRPMYFHFAQNTQMVENAADLAQLAPEGEGTDGTNIAAALEYVVHDRTTEDAPYILILTDGRHNYPTVLSDAVRTVARPIYVAGLGTTATAQSGRRNLAITEVRAPMEAIRNNVSTIKVIVRGTSVPDGDVEVRLIDEETEQTLATVNGPLDKTTGIGEFELKYTPTDPKAGSTSAPAVADPNAPTNEKGSGQAEVRKLKVVVTPIVGEVTEDDNHFELHMLVTNPRIRVLYVEGSIRAGEYKWLKRTMESDPNVQFMGMVRTQGSTFTVQGSIGGSTLQGLPTADADFKLFDVIILGDLDKTYLSNRQIDQLAQWVTAGGGLLMIGGTNSFGPGGYGGTRLEEVLPVTMGGRNMPQEYTKFIPQLTSAGQSHPIFEGIAGYFRGAGNTPPDPTLPPLPLLSGCVTVVSVKPVATLLAVHPERRNEGGPLVALAVQNLGAGRSAAWTADTTWNWRQLLAAQGRESPYSRFWGQMVRYLAGADAKSRNAGTHAMLRLDRTYLERGGTVAVSAMVLDQREQGASEMKVFAHIIPDDATQAPRDPEPMVLASDALYRVSNNWLQNNLPTEGGYTIKITARDAANTELASDEIKVTMAPHLREMDRVDCDTAALDEMASRSGGIFRDSIRLPELLDEMQRRRNLIDAGSGRRNLDTPLYNFPMLFIAFAGLLTTEWLLRRKWQLQ